MNVSPFRIVSLDAQIADETIGQAADCQAYPYVSVWMVGNGTTSSGVVTIEEAEWDPERAVPFGGTWSPITTINASDVSGSAMKGIHLPVTDYAWVRARISTVIGGGGSVTVVLRGTGN